MDRELVKATVIAFDIGEVIGTPTAVAQAWSNAVYRVDTTGGTFAIKLFPPSLSTAQQRRLRCAMALEKVILERGLIQVPQPIRCQGEWIVELPTTIGPRSARCHEWVVGSPAHRPLDPGLIAQAGTYLGRLHAMQQIAGNSSQIPGLALHRWHQAVRSAFEHDVPFAAQLGDLTALVLSLATDLDELRRQRRPMRLSHGDYDPKNTVISDTGQLVITDWDYAGPVLADVEMIVGATSFADTDHDVLAFVQAYRAAGGDALHADALAMTAELADLDWLLRNVEAFTQPNQSDLTADGRTVQNLITSLPADVRALRAWPQRLAAMLELDPPGASCGVKR